ncbi:MAG: isoprenylcysteine carboxylmethyltransferase family protein [Planctomycetales bacterium]|nr:isoprenylcysteine carboxylmethyltransferase family protein [Planctomycetales bacterium]
MSGFGNSQLGSRHVEKSAEVTDVGPYALIRNPLYIGSYCMMVAFCILCKDWGSLAFVSGPVLFIYYLQVAHEEVFLAAKFPNSWTQYTRDVPRFIPQHLSNRMLAGWSLAQWIDNREYKALITSVVGVMAIYCWLCLVR